ncbi:MAG: ribosome-associated translation inhibitor RaiA [Thermaerobacter sp.]|nr:ribosome-associated translation inhibitor RaiA [Thermaerobacter sp.]
MEVVVRSRNIEVTAALKAHVEKKVRKLDKYLTGAGKAQVRLEIEHGRHTAEVTIPVAGLILRGEENGDDMYASVDEVVQKIERQAKRWKGRLQRGRVGASEAEVAEQPAEDASGILVRRKAFPAKPMTPDEAILQMDLVGHDFFAFRNADTETINVVYRRKDGNYGLLEPEG